MVEGPVLVARGARRRVGDRGASSSRPASIPVDGAGSGRGRWPTASSSASPRRETPHRLFAVVRHAGRRDPTCSAPPSFVLVADRIADPGNVGTMLRSAEAAGVDAVVLTPGSVDVVQPEGRPGVGRRAVPRAGGRRRRSATCAAAGLRCSARRRTAATPHRRRLVGPAGDRRRQRGPRPRRRRRRRRSGSASSTAAGPRASTWRWRRPCCTSKSPGPGVADRVVSAAVRPYRGGRARTGAIADFGAPGEPGDG